LRESKSKKDANITLYRAARILASVCLAASTAGIFFASHYWFNPQSFPFSFTGAQTGQVLAYGGILLIIGLASLISPGPAGIIGLLYCVFVIPAHGMSPIPPTPLIPPAVYLPLYGLFMTGCVINLILEAGKLMAAYRAGTNHATRLEQAAAYITLGAIAASILAMILLPMGTAFFFIVMGLILLGIAWFWPGSGGALMALLSGWALYMLIDSNYSGGAKALYGSVLALFLGGGLLYMVAAIRKKHPQSLWQPLLVVVLVVGSIGALACAAYAGKYTSKTITGGEPPAGIPVQEIFFAVAPELEAEMLAVAENDATIHGIIAAHIRTLTSGGKPYIEEGYHLAVGVRLKAGVDIAAWAQSGRNDPALIAAYVGSLVVGFPRETGHNYTFSIDMQAKTVYNLTQVN